MARAPARPADDPSPDDATLRLGTDEELEVNDDEIALQQFLGSLEGDAGVSVTVYRVRPNKPLSYLFKCGATDFSLDKLRDEHGGGDFRIRAYKGRNLIANKAITVEPPIAKPAAPMLPATSSAPSSTVDIERILERQALASREMMLELAKMMLSGRSASDPRKEFFETLNMVKSFVPAPADTAPVDPMGTFMKGIEFARDVASEAGDGEGDGVRTIAKLAEEYLPKIIGLAQRPSNAPRPAQQAAPQPGAPRPMNPMTALVRQHLDTLINAAKSGQAPDAFVDEVLNHVPPAIVDDLLAKADPVATLIAIHPGVAEVRGWFGALLDKIKAALTEDDGSGDAGPDAPSQ